MGGLQIWAKKLFKENSTTQLNHCSFLQGLASKLLGALISRFPFALDIELTPCQQPAEEPQTPKAHTLNISQGEWLHQDCIQLQLTHIDETLSSTLQPTLINPLSCISRLVLLSKCEVTAMTSDSSLSGGEDTAAPLLTRAVRVRGG